MFKRFATLEPELLHLPDGTSCRIGKLYTEFKEWQGPRLPMRSIWARKPNVEYDAGQSVAELAIERTLQKEGWDAVWVSCFGGISFRRGLPGFAEAVRLPESEENAFQAILQRQITDMGTEGGFWDVWAWKPGSRLFLEAKRQFKDRIRPSQCKLLQSAL